MGPKEVNQAQWNKILSGNAKETPFHLQRHCPRQKPLSKKHSWWFAGFIEMFVFGQPSMFLYSTIQQYRHIAVGLTGARYPFKCGKAQNRAVGDTTLFLRVEVFHFGRMPSTRIQGLNFGPFGHFQKTIFHSKTLVHATFYGWQRKWLSLVTLTLLFF